jgi:hypothetical protein
MKLQCMPQLTSVLRVSLLSSFLFGLLIPFPAVAAPAVLSGSEPGSRVNVRSAPSTTSSSPHYGIVGDRVETLRQTQGSDGYTWYYVRFVQSGAEGWVRGDLIQLSGKSSSSRKIAEGRYWVGATGMVIEVKGQQYQFRDEETTTRWKPISELTPIKDGVFKAGQTYWCLSTMPNNRLSVCTANGWRNSR